MICDRFKSDVSSGDVHRKYNYDAFIHTKDQKATIVFLSVLFLDLLFVNPNIKSKCCT